MDRVPDPGLPAPFAIRSTAVGDTLLVVVHGALGESAGAELLAHVFLAMRHEDSRHVDLDVAGLIALDPD